MSLGYVLSGAPCIHFRNNLNNSLYAISVEKKATVAFLGGSITEMTGWRNMVQEDLLKRFPDTEFTFIDAGIPSLGSTPHAFRFQQDVLDHGIPDLLFLEASVNDHTNGFGPREQILGMEGVVRHALTANPYMDIVILEFIYEPFIPLLAEGEQPDVIMNHERVANRYHLTSVNCAQEISDLMLSGKLTWEEFGGTHPAPLGHRYYADDVNAVLDAFTLPEGQYERAPHAIPEPLEVQCYEKGVLVPAAAASDLQGFAAVEEWRPVIEASTRPGFVGVPMLSTDDGGSFEFGFDGRAVGIFCVCGPDSGVAEYSIDGGPVQTLNMWTNWSRGLYLPWLYVLSDTLADGHHTLKFTVPSGKGCHIRDFAVNK